MQPTLQDLFEPGLTPSFIGALEDAVLDRFEILFAHLSPKLSRERLNLITELFAELDLPALLKNAPNASICLARTSGAVLAELFDRYRRLFLRDDGMATQILNALTLGSEETMTAGIDLKRALAALGRENRQWLDILCLKRIQGLSLPEVAGTLDLTVGAVRERLKKADTFLRTHMEVTCCVKDTNQPTLY